MTTFDFPELKEAEGKLSAKRKEMTDIFATALEGGVLDTKKLTNLPGDDAAKAAHVKNLNDEIADLAGNVEKLTVFAKGVNNTVDTHQAAIESGDGHSADGEKSFADLFMESEAYKHKGAQSNVDMKTLLSTTAGFGPDTPRGPIVVPIAQRPVELVDLIPQIRTDAPSVTWMEQTTRTNGAVETAEGVAKSEATIVYTERTSVVRKIAVLLPVTDEQLEDVPQLRSILETDLRNMVRQRLSDQIAAGDGIAPNLLGILNVSGIQTQAKGADPVPDAVYKAMVKVMTTGQANPDAFVTNPLDWQDVRLLRTADGIYIWGNPSDAGPERIWGLRVVLAQGMTQNTGVVGDWGTYARLAIKKDLTVDIGYINDDFGKNRQTLRAEMRVALFFLRPAAYCTVTGI